MNLSSTPVVRALSIALGLAALAAAPARAADAVSYDWGVAYFMSYDNNLEGCGKPILDGIKAGVAGERTIAAVQADFTDTGGMRRYVFGRGLAEETRIESEDSASED